ncbi:hypothetical protein E2C05_22695, partial [Paracraurococcus ruber]
MRPAPCGRSRGACWRSPCCWRRSRRCGRRRPRPCPSARRMAGCGMCPTPWRPPPPAMRIATPAWSRRRPCRRRPRRRTGP